VVEMPLPNPQPSESKPRPKSFIVQTDASGQAVLVDVTDKRHSKAFVLLQEEKLISAEDGFRLAWQGVKHGEVSPISELWENLDDD
jgi:hypothetical protein